MIGFLADHPGAVEVLARWHHAEWQSVMPDWTLAQAQAELTDHASRRTRPTTLVLHRDGVLVGSVSLVDEDAEDLRDCGEPWLASLYVAPAHRGRGYGKQLVTALVRHAAQLGVERLYLFTPGQRDFYARLGWQLDAEVSLRGQRVDLMSYWP